MLGFGAPVICKVDALVVGGRHFCRPYEMTAIV
jgi:hypothetical protein